MVTLQKPLSTATQQQLKTLKKAIAETHDNITAIVKIAQYKSNEAVAEAIIAGEKLIESKKLLPYGGFERWVKENFTKMSFRTAQRYMKLATLKSSLLKTDLGLNQAYALVGIIKDRSLDIENGTITDDDTRPRTTLPAQVVTVKSKAKPTTPRAPLHVNLPTIQRDDVLSRSRFLSNELVKDLGDKLINKLIDKEDARKILKPLIDLLAE